MKTRTGKIAQLPKPIRDDLNQRLQNGKQGPELLKWLNSLPETQDLLTEKYDHQPINRQNLSEWRHGGYEDWLRHQDREYRIQRIAEEGSDLQDREGQDDIFENTARIAIAELMTDIDDLHQLKGEQRWNRLRTFTRELCRMQNAYNRSRREELAWTKWTDRFLGPNDYVEEDEENPFASKTQHPFRNLGAPASRPAQPRASPLEGTRQRSPSPRKPTTSAPPNPVAQIFNLPYRRVALGKPSQIPNHPSHSPHRFPLKSPQFKPIQSPPP